MNDQHDLALTHDATIVQHEVTNDGQYCVFVSDRARPDHFELHAVHLASGCERPLRSFHAEHRQVCGFRLAPNSREVVYLVRDRETREISCLAQALDGGEARLLGRADQVHGVWIAPDSSRVVLATSDADGLQARLVQVSLDGRAAARLLAGGRTADTVSDVRFTADGRQVIVLLEGTSTERARLLAVALDGSSIADLTADLDPDLHVQSFHPLGNDRVILEVRDHLRRGGLFLRRLDGTGLVRLDQRERAPNGAGAEATGCAPASVAVLRCAA